MESATINNMINVYVLIDPRDLEIKYVGKTKQQLHRRLNGHLLESKETHRRARWINKLSRLGYKPIIELVQVVSPDCWRQAENYWIGYYRSIGCDLVNSTEGGDGGDTFTAEVKAKMSALKKGKTPPWRVGAKHSDATKDKIRRTKTGTIMSTEARAKMSESRKGIQRTAAQREAMKGDGNPFFGKTHSRETRVKMSLAKKGRHKTHCVHGHEFTPENTKMENNHQRCIACRRLRQQSKKQPTWICPDCGKRVDTPSQRGPHRSTHVNPQNQKQIKI